MTKEEQFLKTLATDEEKSVQGNFQANFLFLLSFREDFIGFSSAIRPCTYHPRKASGEVHSFVRTYVCVSNANFCLSKVFQACNSHLLLQDL